MICIEDYPEIELAINRARVVCREHDYTPTAKELIELASVWIDAWADSKLEDGKITEDYAKTVKAGVRNYIFL